MPGTFLEEMNWVEAERALGPEAVVVIPIGAAAKEHGPHLRLSNDWLLADELRRRLAARTPVVIAPVVGFSYYPAFAEYPGSISLRLETARDLVVEIVRSLARHGPRRFYALNTGISTIRALRPAAEILAAEGIALHYTDLARALAPIEKQVSQQEGGSHADEIETSMMLYIAPQTVDMERAAKDYRPGSGPLTRHPDGPGVYSPTGTWGTRPWPRARRVNAWSMRWSMPWWPTWTPCGPRPCRRLLGSGRIGRAGAAPRDPRFRPPGKSEPLSLQTPVLRIVLAHCREERCQPAPSIRHRAAAPI